MNEWDFSGDEAFFLLIAGILSVVGLFRWYIPLLRFAPRLSLGSLSTLLLTPPLAMLFLFGVLVTLADPNYVQNHADYLLLFMIGGGAWIAVTHYLIRFLGLDIRDDAMERRNPAAGYASAGAVFATMACYAGGNIGAGPTIWTTLVPAFFASCILIVLWMLIESATGISDNITLDRDSAAGVRHAGALLAIGIILGRAAAGDWTSWSSTYFDLAWLSLPALALAGGIVVLHRILRPTAVQPRRSTLAAGLVPAAALVITAVFYIMILPPPDVGKHVITYEQYTGHE